MAPFTAWLPAQSSDREPDLIVKIAGDGVASLMNGITALEEALADQGFTVIAQTSTGDETGSLAAARMHVATEPISSLGDGYDVVACLTRSLVEQRQFKLQRGSVLVYEASGDGRPSPGSVPDGVILYPVPFSDLQRRCGLGLPGKGLIAVGVLTHLLGIPIEAVRSRVRVRWGIPYFEAGVKFASDHLVKRDIYVLPAPASARSCIMLDAYRAALLGFAFGICDFETACVERLNRSYAEWVAEHLDLGRRVVSSWSSRKLRGVRTYKGLLKKVTTLFGIRDLSVLTEGKAQSTDFVFLAADLPDAVRLINAGHKLVRAGATSVRIVAEDALTKRRQSVSAETMAQIVQGKTVPSRTNHHPTSPAAISIPRAERDGACGAEIGYVAWGMAQGVVREAVGLCRMFGLNVAGLYPTCLWPFPVQDLDSFAAAVKRLVIVEPNQAGVYTDFVRSRIRRPFSTFRPAAGKRLTAINIFMCEGLGA